MFARNFRSLASLAVLTLAAASSVNASPVGGTKYDEEVIFGFKTLEYSVTLRGGEETLVRIAGDGSTDLDFFVYDENWNLIASDTDRSDWAVLSLIPRRTGTFHIQIVNNGRYANAYAIVIE